MLKSLENRKLESAEKRSEKCEIQRETNGKGGK